MSGDRPWTERPPHLLRWIDPRNGKERIYFRKRGAPKKPLRSAWGTQALADEVAAELRRVKTRPPAAVGTLTGAVRVYRGDAARGVKPSADFVALAISTQGEYERICDEFETTFDGVLLEDIDAGYILELRDAWAAKGYRAANLRLQVLKNLCKGPMIRGDIAGDPFALIDKVARPQSLGVANPRWLDEEVLLAIETAIAKKDPGLANAIALGRWGGFRRQSICKLPRNARIWRDGDAGRERRLFWVTEKRLVLCDRREDPRLTALLERTAKISARFAGNVAATRIAFNTKGGPWTVRALTHALDRLLKPLIAEGRVRAGLTLHGLRHARGVELALAGASDAGIMSQLDHATPRQAALYRKQAERLTLADAAQDQVDANIVKLAARRAAKEG